MDDKQIRRLRRYQLIDIIYQLQTNEEQLHKRIEELEAELADRRIRIANAGSIAEAVMDLSGAMAQVQKAAEEYLEQAEMIKRDAAQQKEELIAKVVKEAEAILDEAAGEYERQKAQAQDRLKHINDQIDALEQEAIARNEKAKEDTAKLFELAKQQVNEWIEEGKEEFMKDDQEEPNVESGDSQCETGRPGEETA